MSITLLVTARTVAEAGRRIGVRVLNAPVSGGEQGGIDGTLSVMIEGEAADVTAAWPVLDAAGRTIVHVGPSGAGQTVKAANQLVSAGNIQLVTQPSCCRRRLVEQLSCRGQAARSSSHG
ncbi:MAG: NAD(P)-binding domain-containing protein [Streptosporangiaceae bacterium]